MANNNDQEGWSLFGFEIKRKKIPETQKSFAPEIKDDGAVVVAAGGSYGTYIDLEGTVKTEADLVSKYREMSLQPEIDKAVNEIVNDAIVNEDGKKTVEIILDDVPIKDDLKKVITDEFEIICDLLDFQNSAYDVFKRWYIDGRSYYHAVIDENSPGEGIKELRYIDPRKIRKIREIIRKTDPKTNATIQKTRQEYYLYNERGLNNSARVLTSSGATGVKIKADSIIQATSGLMNQDNTLVLSYLQAALKPLNQLRALEDSSLIYHLSRAPERRIFYIDVGNMPRPKAEQYLRDMMVKHKNKLAYDSSTGEIRDDRKFMTMLEDYWFPRREGNTGTEIDILNGGTALPQLLESVQYFQDRMYRSLQVPISRMKSEEYYSLGRATEISRDELNFAKFIDRLRGKFNQLFLKSLEKQLILKGITVVEDWEKIKKHIQFRYLRDVYQAELKDMEILGERLNRLQAIDPYVGRYYSAEWTRKNVLRQTDDDIAEMDQQMETEKDDPRYGMEMMMQQQQFDTQQAQLMAQQAEAEAMANGDNEPVDPHEDQNAAVADEKVKQEKFKTQQAKHKVTFEKNRAKQAGKSKPASKK